MLKKVIIFTLLSAILFSSFCFFVTASESNQATIEAEGYYLFDLNHNMLMESENANKIISPSSTAKIMTACIVLESGIDLNKQITVTKSMIKNVTGRQMFLKEGDILTVKDLLYAMICGGYNDATNILALTISTTLTDFTNQMNEKANEIGMKNTHYLNPTGIEQDGMYTTVNDIFKLSKYMVNNSFFVDISSTKSYQLSSVSLCDYSSISNRSSLLNAYKGLASFSAGSSDNGDCSVSFYKTAELSLITIVMNAKSTNTKSNCAEEYSKALINKALNNYSSVVLKTKSDIITSLPVKYSTSGKDINVYLQEDLSVFISNEVDVLKDITYSIYIQNDELTAPLKSGDTVGTISVFYDGKLMANVPLIVKENIDKNNFLYSMDVIKNFILSKAFLLIILLVFILSVVYFKSKKRNFNKKKRKPKTNSQKSKKYAVTSKKQYKK